jgi:stage V sporulation protein G
VDITDIKVKLMDDRSDKLAAFCSIIIEDSFIIQDLKIIRGPQGIFVAMPSRKLADKCPRCGGKNHLRARYCNDCGTRLSEERAPIDANGRATLHADIAHPLNSAIREMVQRRVLAAYAAELENTDLPSMKFSGELATASEAGRRFGDGLT